MPYLPPFMALNNARAEIRPVAVPAPATAPPASPNMRRTSGLGESPTLSERMKTPGRSRRLSDTLGVPDSTSTPRKKARTDTLVRPGSDEVPLEKVASYRDVSEESTEDSIIFDPPELAVGFHRKDPSIPVYAKIRRAPGGRAVLFTIHKDSEVVEESEFDFPNEQVAFNSIIFDHKFLADDEAEIKSLIRSHFKEVKPSGGQMHEVTLGEPDLGAENGRDKEAVADSVTLTKTVLPLRERLLRDLTQYMGQEGTRERDNETLRKKLAAQKEVATTYAKTNKEQASKIMEQESKIMEQKSEIEAQRSKIEGQAQQIAELRGQIDGWANDMKKSINNKAAD